MLGALLGKLPSEDASALVRTVLAEQHADGSWGRTADGPGDLSLTLEVVEALSQAGDGQAQTALARAVGWLEAHRLGARLDEETLILLSAVADMVPGRLRRWLLPLARLVMRHRAGTSARRHRSEVLPLALSLLSRDRNGAFGRYGRLLELQMLDGSWEGATHTTVCALAALRHAGLAPEDAAFERGWRFLRSLQLWSGDRLVQNPCDLSNVLHAAAVRALLVAGAESDVAASSTLSLLHQARMHGGWAAGGMLPTDLMSTALALDALSFAGDVPVETAWSRRRAVLLLLRTQHGAGGWPLYPDAHNTRLSRLRTPHGPRTNPSSLDVTAACVQALAYAGVRVAGEDAALARGVHFLLARQLECGLLAGGPCGLGAVHHGADAGGAGGGGRRPRGARGGAGDCGAARAAARGRRLGRRRGGLDAASYRLGGAGAERRAGRADRGAEAGAAVSSNSASTPRSCYGIRQGRRGRCRSARRGFIWPT